MRVIEVKGQADVRLVALGLAHGLELTRKTVILTDDVSFIRVGERVKERVYRCDQVYVVIIPELYSAESVERAKELIESGVATLERITGERAEEVVLSWHSDLNIDFEVKANIQVFRTGMRTTDADEYDWKRENLGNADSGSLTYIIFYDQKAYKKASYEAVEKVIVTDSEMSAIRRMEQENRFKLVSGGYFNIANDIAVKRCGVFESALRELKDKK